VKHELKCWPEFFNATRVGSKRFELCKEDDKHFTVGDMLVLREWDPKKKDYTGCRFEQKITYVLRNIPGLEPGYTILSVQ